MNELVERVAEAIYESTRAHLMTVFRVPAATASWEFEDAKGRRPFLDQARAAIAAVRAWDVERGPSEAEIEAALLVFSYADLTDSLNQGLQAAAVERARGEGVQ
jgi:hypothetical protein